MKDSIYLFQWFTEKGCKVSREKLQLSLGPINYLGHDLRAEGIWLPPKRVKWNQEFPRTTTKWQLCVFLGLAGYCRLLFHTFLYYKWAGLYKTKWSTARTTCPRAPKPFKTLSLYFCRKGIINPGNHRAGTGQWTQATAQDSTHLMHCSCLSWLSWG